MREIRADLDTALSLFKRLDDGETSFLFESVAGAEKWARYSFMGRGARAIFRTRGQTVEWTESGQSRNFEIEGDPLVYLRERLAAIDAVIPDTGGDLPPFLGGAVGFVSYDWVRFVEKIPDANPDEVGLPDLWFVFPEIVVIHDNARHTAFVVRHVEVAPGDDRAAIYEAAVSDEKPIISQSPIPAWKART